MKDCRFRSVAWVFAVVTLLEMGVADPLSCGESPESSERPS